MNKLQKRQTESSRKKNLLSLTCVLALVLWGLAIGSGFAAKPGSTAVRVTFRSGPPAALDGVRGDGFPHAATIDTAGPSLYYFWSTGEVSYDLTNNSYTDDPINCPSGQVSGTLSGGGNLRVTLDAGTWLGMTVGASGTGFATYNISGTTSQFGTANYLLRFRTPDDLNVTPAQNCSTQVTITRTATGAWVVETDASDIARLLKNGTRGPGFANLGHYKPAFEFTVTNP